MLRIHGFLRFGGRDEAGRVSDPVRQENLTRQVLDELHRLAESLMRGERRANTLQPTALVNECFVRLAKQENLSEKNRAELLAAAAVTMRRILVDHARAKTSDKRGGRSRNVGIDVLIECFHPEPQPIERYLDLEEALVELASIDTTASRIIDLRFFCAQSIDEVAVCLGLSRGTVVNHFRTARAWLRSKLA